MLPYMIIHGKENMFKWGVFIAALPLKEEQKNTVETLLECTGHYIQ